jgi:hypothetical protein
METSARITSFQVDGWEMVRIFSPRASFTFFLKKTKQDDQQMALAI